MKIIDFGRKGNVVRFYLGEKTPEWGWTNKDWKGYDGKGLPDHCHPSDKYYGDDWNDTPYEHNAGSVYPEFIKGYKDIAFGYDDMVFEPCDGEWNSRWCKDDMVARKVPCLVVLPKKLIEAATEKADGYLWISGFSQALAYDGAVRYYFGDEMDPDPEQ